MISIHVPPHRLYKTTWYVNILHGNNVRHVEICALAIASSAGTQKSGLRTYGT